MNKASYFDEGVFQMKVDTQSKERSMDHNAIGLLLTFIFYQEVDAEKNLERGIIR